MEGLRLVSRQFRKQRLAQWAGGCGLEPYFTAMVFWLCETVLWHGASLAVQEGGRMEGLRLVSRQFRKQRLAQWAGGCGLEPYFTAMVFWLCETVLCAELCWQCRKAGEWKV